MLKILTLLTFLVLTGQINSLNNAYNPYPYTPDGANLPQQLLPKQEQISPRSYFDNARIFPCSRRSQTKFTPASRLHPIQPLLKPVEIVKQQNFQSQSLKDEVPQLVENDKETSTGTMQLLGCNMDLNNREVTSQPHSDKEKSKPSFVQEPVLPYKKGKTKPEDAPKNINKQNDFDDTITNYFDLSKPPMVYDNYRPTKDFDYDKPKNNIHYPPYSDHQVPNYYDQIKPEKPTDDSDYRPPIEFDHKVTHYFNHNKPTDDSEQKLTNDFDHDHNSHHGSEHHKPTNDFDYDHNSHHGSEHQNPTNDFDYDHPATHNHDNTHDFVHNSATGDPTTYSDDVLLTDILVDELIDDLERKGDTKPNTNDSEDCADKDPSRRSLSSESAFNNENDKISKNKVGSVRNKENKKVDKNDNEDVILLAENEDTTITEDAGKLIIDNTKNEILLIDPTKGSNITDILKLKTLLLANSRVCYACTSKSDASCWTPNRSTTTKYCRKGHDSCLTKAYDTTDSGRVVIRDCGDTCDAVPPTQLQSYASCSICQSDLCNNQHINSGAFCINSSFNIIVILFITIFIEQFLHII